MNVAIVGGHGNISMRLARLLASRAGTTVTSIFRDVAHLDEVAATGAAPVVLSLEDDSKEKFAAVFEGKDIVYFSAGAGGKGGPERTKKVDYEGALKVFDAMELVKGPKPRLILVSAIDVRDRNAPVPSHYTEGDVKNSEQIWSTIGFYMEAKYDADKNLTQRSAFKWTIIRPGWLSFEPGTGKATVGKAPLAGTISRDDVALTLALLADRPSVAGLVIDLNSGETKIEEALDAFVQRGVSDFLG